MDEPGSSGHRQETRVLLLDAYNLLFRAFASLPRTVTDRRGQPINALFGFLGALVKLTRDLEPAHVVAAFDVPEVPTFRHRLYPAYQGHRGPLGGEHADEFRQQVSMAVEGLNLLGVPALTKAGYEADDIIGSVARLAGQAAYPVTIVSTDRDLFQLVRPGVRIVPPGSTATPVEDAEGVVRRIGVVPAAVPTFKALAGDASDNIPGVRGIGTKGAATLVNRYGDLDAVYEHLGEVSPRVARALEAGRDDAYLFRTVATITTDLDLGLEVQRLPSPVISKDTRVGTLLVELGHRSG